MNKERLLNVAKALRESPNPAEFTMLLEVSGCNTPACAWGHYFFRTDLQSEFEPIVEDDGEISSYARHKPSGLMCTHMSRSTLNHFDIDEDEAEELFGGIGCGDAQTAIQAAEYIERFVERNS